MGDVLENYYCEDIVKTRLHYIYCVYGDSKDKPTEEIREFFSMDVGDDTNIYNMEDFEFCLAKNGEEYVKFFDDKSPFVPWNMAFKRNRVYLGCDETCYFGINYLDVFVPIEELKDIQNQIKKRRNELCLM